MKNLCLFLLALVLTGCSGNEWTDTKSEEDNSYLNVSIDNPQTKSGTEVGTDVENAINHLAFYIFKKSGSLEKKYQFTGADVSLSKQYSMICSSGEKYVYVVANAPQLFASQELGTKYPDFQKANTALQATMPASPFVMAGKYTNLPTDDLLNLVPNPDNTPSTTNINVAIERLVGKVTLSATTAVSSKFEIKTFRVVNANPYSYFFKQSTSVKFGSSADQINPANEALFNSWTESYYLDNYKQSLPNEAAYAFENWNSDPRRGNTTAIIIGGIYKGSNPANTKVTYYRFNLGGKPVKWAFNRNTHYKVQITEVYEEGYENEEDAEEGKPDGKPTDPLVQDVQITGTITLQPWTIIDQSGEIGKE